MRAFVAAALRRGCSTVVATACVGAVLAGPAQAASKLGEQPFYKFDTQQLTDRLAVEVNLANGNLIVHGSDIAVAGTGLRLEFDRYYNNLSTSSGSFGSGWSMSTGRDVRLDVQSNGDVVYTGRSAIGFTFTKNTDGS